MGSKKVRGFAEFEDTSRNLPRDPTLGDDWAKSKLNRVAKHSKLVAMRTPDYILKRPVTFSRRGDPITLPAGVFVRPIEWEYVPKHVLEDEAWRPHRKATYIFVYTRYGFVKVERADLCRVGS